MENMCLNVFVKICVYILASIVVFTNVSVCTGGGIALQVSGHGLNKVIAYGMDVQLPKLMKDYEFKQTSHKLRDGVSIDILKLDIVDIAGQYGNVTVGVDNTLDLEFGFAALKISSTVNLNIEGSEDEYQGEHTNVVFEKGMLTLELIFGRDEMSNPHLSVKSCTAKIDNVDADGTLSLLIKIAASDSAIEDLIISDVCPLLEDLVNEDFNGILDIADTLKGTVDGVSLESSLYLENFGTQNGNIYINGFVDFRKPGTAAVKPTGNLPSLATSGYDMYLIFDENVLNGLLTSNNKSVDVFSQSIETETDGVILFDTTKAVLSLKISSNSVKFNLASTAKLTNNSDGEDFMTAKLVGVLPINMQYNDTFLQGEFKQESFVMSFDVQSSSQKWTEYEPEQKCAILNNYFQRVKNNIEKLKWSFALPETDVGIKDLNLSLHQSSLEIGGNIRVQKLPNTWSRKKMRLKYALGNLDLTEVNDFTNCSITRSTTGATDKAKMSTMPSLMVVLLCLVHTLWLINRRQ